MLLCTPMSCFHSWLSRSSVHWARFLNCLYKSDIAFGSKLRFFSKLNVQQCVLLTAVFSHCLLPSQAVRDQSDPRPGDPGWHRGPGEGESPGQEDLQAAAEQPQQQEEEGGLIQETCTHAEEVQYCHTTVGCMTCLKPPLKTTYTGNIMTHVVCSVLFNHTFETTGCLHKV